MDKLAHIGGAKTSQSAQFLVIPGQSKEINMNSGAILRNLVSDTIRMDRRITLQIGGYQMCEGRTLCSLVLEGMLSY